MPRADRKADVSPRPAAAGRRVGRPGGAGRVTADDDDRPVPLCTMQR